MKKIRANAIKLLFIIGALGSFPFFWPGVQFQHQISMNYSRSFDVRLPEYRVPFPVSTEVGYGDLTRERPGTSQLAPIEPVLGPEVQPDTIE